MILEYGIKAFALLGLMSVFLVLVIKVEYVFYFLLASRGIIDELYDVEAMGNIRITQSIAIFIVVLFSSYFIITGYNIFRSGVNKVYLLFILITFSAVLASADLISAFGDWLKLLQIILILNMATIVVLKTEDHSYKKRIITIFWCIIIALFVPYISFLNNIIHGNYIMMKGYSRFADIGGYANSFSYSLLAAFPICLFFYTISSKRSKKIFWLVFMGIMLITIYKTYTRNVWIGVAIIFLTWNLIRKNFKLIVICLVAGIIIVSFNPEVRDRFSEFSEILSTENISNMDPKLLSGRVERWQTNLKYFINESTFIEKLFGNGFDVKSKVASIYLGIGDTAEHFEHNNYLTLLMNTGIFGLCTYCLFIFKMFEEAFKLLRRTHDIYFKTLAQIFISVLSSYVVISFFTHMLWKVNYQYYFCTLAGLVIAANILEEKNRNLTRLIRV
jgi:hypothetical protein